MPSSCHRMLLWSTLLLPGFVQSSFVDVPPQLSSTTSSNNNNNSNTLNQDARSLTTSSQVCDGGLICLNNGHCAEGHNYHQDGAVCDCTTAVQILGTGQGEEGYEQWVGRSCQIRVTNNDYCNNNNQFSYCVNGGTCRNQAKDFADRPCKCLDGFSGRHCEYDRSAGGPDPSACSLTCNGKGTCHFGFNPHADQGANKALPSTNSHDFMYCICEDGHAGTNCEFDFTECRDPQGQVSKHFCYHGATCLPGTGICQCQNDQGVQFAGDYCQFKESDTCATPIVIDAAAAALQFDEANKLTYDPAVQVNDPPPFCVNGGACFQVETTNDYYCLCAADDHGGLWTGPQCTIPYMAAHLTQAPTAAGTDTWGPTIDGSWTTWPSSDGPSSEAPTDAPIPTVPFVQCGNLHCLNGGFCASGHNYQSKHAVCDCRTAIKDEGEDRFTAYAGRECEIEVLDPQFCPGTEQTEFCINGGTCRGNANNFDQKPCTCPNGFKGRNCEIPAEHAPESCGLTCSNNGRCEHGLNPTEKKGANGLLNLDNEGSSNFMHCICDEGFAGINCEYEVTKCAGRQRYCFHGSTCIDVAGGPDLGGEQVCECDGDDGKKLTGPYCEFEATDYCNNPVLIDETNAVQSFSPTKQLNTDEVSPFCVNDGICYMVESLNHYYCQCDEILFTGNRCETQKQSLHLTAAPTAAWTDTWPPTVEASLTDMPVAPTRPPTTPPYALPTPPTTPTLLSQNSSTDDDNISGGGKFGIVLVVAVGLACIAFVMLYFRRRARYLKRMVYQDGDPHTGPDSIFRADDNKHLDIAPFEEEEHVVELSATRSMDSDEVPGGDQGKFNNTSGGAQAPEQPSPENPSENKEMSQVELV